MSTGGPLLDVRNLVQEFEVRAQGGVRSGTVQAVSDISFTLAKGETLGLVGETGSGKSTLARAILQAPRPKSGEVLFEGIDLVKLRGKELLRARRQIQMVFQDPYGSLDPKWSVARIVEEPLIAFRTAARAERRSQVNEALDRVGLDPARYADRRPRSLSGGQAQRVAIARALALDPALIIYDEAVSSLDVLVRAQVLNLLERLRTELSLTYLFIAHDLALVKQVSDRVAVMYLGKLVEIGPAESLYREPLHPYTVALLASIPNPDPTRDARARDGNDPGGAALTDRSAERLPVPHPVSARAGRVREDRAAAPATRRRPLRRMSLSGIPRCAGAGGARARPAGRRNT